MSTTGDPSEPFASRLAKRLPRVMVPYVGGTWGVVQCLDWSTTRYLLSPSLVELAIYAAVLLIPTAILLAYFRGERTPWTRAEKLGIPLNLVFAATLLVITFHGKDLGAVTRQIEVKNANGQTVERQVPKSAYRKHVALFFFENRSGDAALDWLGQGVPILLDIDLSQDLFIESKTQYGFVGRIKKASLPPRDVLPLALEIELAHEAHIDFIVSGSFTRQGADYLVDVSLTTASRGKPVAERHFRGPDPFKLVDEMSIQLRKDLGIPSAHVEDSPDLPVSEISTRSLPALRAYVLAENASKIDNDARASIEAFEQAVKIDPTFGYAWFEMTGVLFEDNQQQRSAAAMAQTLRNQYRLAERSRLEFESMNAILNKDPEKELGILRQWVTLYPDDDLAHQRLASTYQRRNWLDDALAEYELLYTLDPNASYLIESGSIRERKGDYAAALKDYLRYQERSPSDAVGYVRAASVEERMARHEQAKAGFERALAIDPDHVEALVGVSRVEMRLGRLDRAQEAVDRALKQSLAPPDLVTVLEQQSALLELQGKLNQSVETKRKMCSVWKQSESASDYLRDQLGQVDTFVKAGKKDEALAILAEAQKAADNPNVAFSLHMASADVYLLLGDAARAARAVDEVEKIMKTYEVGALGPWVGWYRGRIDELNGAYASAIARYQEFLKLSPSTAEARLALARCQRRQKQFKEAHASLAQGLAFFPASARLHVELARLFADEGDRGRARTELDAALRMWAQADPAYQDAADARALAAQLAH
jgi:tetratricopeptide (TPR) repeat protein